MHHYTEADHDRALQRLADDIEHVDAHMPPTRWDEERARIFNTLPLGTTMRTRPRIVKRPDGTYECHERFVYDPGGKRKEPPLVITGQGSYERKHNGGESWTPVKTAVFIAIIAAACAVFVWAMGGVG